MRNSDLRRYVVGIVIISIIFNEKGRELMFLAFFVAYFKK